MRGALAMSDRLRAINVPQRVEVEVDAAGNPVTVARSAGPSVRRSVEVVLESWRVDDEWWRRPLTRTYYELLLEGGHHVVLYRDLNTREWWMQKP